MTGAIGRDFFARSVHEVAPDLIGATLLVDGVGGRIVEVEAYDQEDPASHGFRGRTPRNTAMFGPPGHAYVYFTYGMHHCLNFVTREEGIPQAVLIRALEPGPGVGRCSGPGLICRSLSIDRTLNGVQLSPPHLYVVDDGEPQRRVFETPRIGVHNSGDWAAKPLRFCLDSPHLSRPLPRAFRAVGD